MAPGNNAASRQIRRDNIKGLARGGVRELWAQTAVTANPFKLVASAYPYTNCQILELKKTGLTHHLLEMMLSLTAMLKCMYLWNWSGYEGLVLKVTVL